MALPNLDTPVEIRRGILAEVKAFLKRHGQPFVETFLVEIKRRLKGRRRPREERGARENEACFEVVVGGGCTGEDPGR